MTENWWRGVDPSDFGPMALRSTVSREAHCAVLAALLVASTRTPMVTLPEVRTFLTGVGFHDPLHDSDLRDILDQLSAGPHVSCVRDYTAPVSSYDAALRRQEAWALTKRGRIVLPKVRAIVNELGRSLQLPPKLLEDIEATIRALLDHLKTEPARLPLDFNRIQLHTDQLHAASGDFYEAVAALVRLDITDDDVFTGSRERILQVLRQFANHTQLALDRVQAAAAELAQHGHAAVAEAALPHAGLMSSEEEVAWIGDAVQKLGGLHAWFQPAGAVERLVDASLGAIGTLLGAIERRFYAVSHGSDLGADFRQLARMIHAQPTERDANEVFAAAFGLWPARHPRRPDTESIAALTPSDAGQRCAVQVTLRRTDVGSVSTGRPPKIPDVSTARTAGEFQMLTDLAHMSRVIADLTTPGPVYLDYFTGLDAEHTEALVALLEEALDAAGAFDVPVTVERWDCTVTAWPSEQDQGIDVEVAEGTLTAPDLRIAITLTEDAEADMRGAI